jgi:hypothetical protein
MFVPYAFLYHSSDCYETSVSCCAHAREDFWITFLLLNIKTFTISAKFHEIFNEVLGMSAGHLTYDVRECLSRGRWYHDNLQITPRVSPEAAAIMTITTPPQAVVWGVSGRGVTGFLGHFPFFCSLKQQSSRHTVYSTRRASRYRQWVYFI